LIPHFERVNVFLDKVLYGPDGERHAVLVHGNTGSSRSPCFIAAFLMEKFNMEYAGAFAIIQGRRFCVNPNDAFKAQLKVCLNLGGNQLGWQSTRVANAGKGMASNLPSKTNGDNFQQRQTKATQRRQRR